jgi:hypothetical protein
MSVALLFLTIADPHFPVLWDRWLDDSAGRCDVYIHPKYPDKVTWRRNAIISQLVGTQWGEIVFAYGALFAEAIASGKRYSKYVLVSESDVPVRAFETFYRAMCMSPSISYYTYIGNPTRWDRENRLSTVSSYHNIVKHSARFALCHNHAVQFAELVRFVSLMDESDDHKSDPLYDFASKLFRSSVSDEFCLSVLSRSIQTDPSFENYSVVEDNWNHTKRSVTSFNRQIEYAYQHLELPSMKHKNHHVQKIKQELNATIKNLQSQRDQVRKSPIAMDDLTKVVDNSNDLDYILNLVRSKYPPIFMRKFAKTSNIYQFWYDIILAVPDGLNNAEWKQFNQDVFTYTV